MKIVAYATLLYGLDYLKEAVRSVIDDVDAIWFMYTPTPTFTHNHDLVNPDSAENLFAFAQESAGAKCGWYTARAGQFRNEGEHCDYIYTLAPDADVYVRLDVDEIWTAGLLRAAIDFGIQHNAARVRVPFYHYWRSFRRAMIDDPAYPDRVKFRAGQPDIDVTIHDAGRIHHMGYAQHSSVVEYKQRISSHAGEWRWGDNWFENVFLANRQYDCHPVSRNWWTPVDVDPYALGMPEYMRQHPYADLEVTP